LKVKKNTMRILILEDNYSDADLSKRALERNFRGCSIDLAATLNAARQFLDKDSGYDVALLDMNLPDGNGLEFLTELKARKTPTAIVVFTSGTKNWRLPHLRPEPTITSPKKPILPANCRESSALPWKDTKKKSFFPKKKSVCCTSNTMRMM